MLHLFIVHLGEINAKRACFFPLFTAECPDSTLQMIEQITLIGSGNVATNLGHALQKNGIRINEVHSSSHAHAEKLARQLGCDAQKKIENLSTNSDLLILAINDDLIDEVAATLPNKSQLIVHTSGSTGMQVLEKNGFLHYGVFYPLQSLSKNNLISFENVPICIEANFEHISQQLIKLGKTISGQVVKINSEERKHLHLAAVFVNNFPNHLYTIAEEILQKQQLSFELLKPLITRTTEKVLHHQAITQQTGPAIRKDTTTQQQHIKLLKSEMHRQLYTLLSKSIVQTKKA